MKLQLYLIHLVNMKTLFKSRYSMEFDSSDKMLNMLSIW